MHHIIIIISKLFVLPFPSVYRSRSRCDDTHLFINLFRSQNCDSPTTDFVICVILLLLGRSQVASNVIIGRSHLGVHYRMDGVYGALMGETSAVRRLQQVNIM